MAKVGFILSLIVAGTLIVTFFCQIGGEPPEYEEYSESEYVLDTLFENENIKPRDYNYKKENIWKLNCTESRMKYLRNITYGQKENYFFNMKVDKYHYDFKSILIDQYGDVSNYEYGKRIGSGHYANVFLAKDKSTNDTVVIKNLNAIKIDKIKREYHILKILEDGPNIIKLIDIFPLKNKTDEAMNENQKYVFLQKQETQAKDGEGNPQEGDRVSASQLARKSTKASFVFEYLTTSTVHKAERFLIDMDIRCVIYDTLKALKYAHAMGVMHRDIKPGNIIYHQPSKQTKLIDFGLAEFFHMDKSYHYRVATKTYKPPELLLNYTCYDYSMDTWGVGITMAQLIFRKRPFYPGKEDINVLRNIVRHHGSDKLLELVKKLDIKVDHFTANRFKEKMEPRQWEWYETPENQQNLYPEALDLLDKMLEFDFTQRISPQDALEHPYFDPIRDFKEGRNQTEVIFNSDISVDDTSETESEEDDLQLNNTNSQNHTGVNETSTQNATKDIKIEENADLVDKIFSRFKNQEPQEPQEPLNSQDNREIIQKIKDGKYDSIEDLERDQRQKLREQAEKKRQMVKDHLETLTKEEQELYKQKYQNGKFNRMQQEAENLKNSKPKVQKPQKNPRPAHDDDFERKRKTDL